VRPSSVVLDRVIYGRARKHFTYGRRVAQPRMLISQQLIEGYSAGPSSTRTATVKSLHENVRAALAAVIALAEIPH
jgi:hypothetical protein